MLAFAPLENSNEEIKTDGRLMEQKILEVAAVVSPCRLTVEFFKKQPTKTNSTRNV